MRKFLSYLSVLAALVAVACKKENITVDCDHKVIVVREHIRAHVMMSFGFNNLSNALAEDIGDLSKGYIPGNAVDDNYLFIYSHLSGANYATQTSPCLQRVYKDPDGNIVKKTILTLEPGTMATSGESIKKVMEFLKEKYPEIECYGILLSSHGTGWAPPGYCTSGYKTDGGDDESIWSSSMSLKPYLSGEYLYEPTPGVKSFGYQVTGVNPTTAYETDIRELANILPFKLDYVIFDACFMGGVEVAYEFKDKCNYMCFSQTEILSDGMDYTTMMSDLLEFDSPLLVSLATNYFEHYDKESGYKRSATISVVDCSKLDVLAAVCKVLFRKYDIRKDNVNESFLQKYYHYTNHAWFYDLYSIVEAAGYKTLSSKESSEYAFVKEDIDTDLSDLQWALDQCVAYKAATPTFALYGFPIRIHSGLSMYLPVTERTQLNSYYRELSWNKVTGLVNEE